MASVSREPNSKGQIVVTWYWQGATNKFQDAFRSLEEAQAHKKLVEREVEKSKRQGKPTAFIQGRLDSKTVKRQGLQAKDDIQLLAQHIKATTPSIDTKTAEEVFSSYIRKLELRNRSPYTVKEYRNTWTIFRDHIKKKFLADISHEDIDSFLDKLREAKNAPPTINKHLRHLRAILRFAAEMDYIIKSPLKQGSFITEPDGVEPFLYPDEAEALLEAAQEISGEMHKLCAIGYYTGARLNEALNVQWKHFTNLDLALNPTFQSALDKRHMTAAKKDEVAKVISQWLGDGSEDTFEDYLTAEHPEIARWVETPPVTLLLSKRKRGFLTEIPVLPILKDILAPYAKDRHNHTYPTDYVVKPNELPKTGIGYRWQHTKQFQTVLKKAGLDKLDRNGIPITITFHSLRYSFASLLITAGVPEALVARYCAHHTQQMARHYQNPMFKREGILSTDEARIIRRTFNPYGE